MSWDWEKLKEQQQTKRGVPPQVDEIVNQLKKRQIAAVNLRFDKNIIYGKYVIVMDMCLRAGIDNIFTVYEMNDKGGYFHVKNNWY